FDAANQICVNESSYFLLITHHIPTLIKFSREIRIPLHNYIATFEMKRPHYVNQKTFAPPHCVREIAKSYILGQESFEPTSRIMQDERFIARNWQVGV